MPTRTARTVWTGNLADGSGKVELSSSQLAEYTVSFPTRAADIASGSTSPEELLAAAHSACFAMQLSALLGEAGGEITRLDVSTDVSLGPDRSGGFALTGVHMTLIGEVAGLDEATFLHAAHSAKEACPVSKALTGVEITLNAVARPSA